MNISESNIAMEDEEKFRILIESKLQSLGLSDNIIEKLSSVKSKLFLNYDPLNEMDIYVLNNKLEHIYQAEISGEYDLEQLYKIAFQTLKTKE